MNPMDGNAPSLELMEPASPGALLPDSRWWLWLAAAIVVLAASGVILYLRKKRSAGSNNPGALRDAAFAEAVAAMAAIATDDVRNAAVLASLILRKYLSIAAGDPALFETHEEFVARHDALSALTAEARAATAEGFGRLAALKYAPEIPAAAEEEVIAQARTLLETLHHGFAA